MRLADSTVSQVKQYDDIVSVVSDFVGLKRRGRNFIGLCPFHSEKTPSFTVSPERRMFHCFGCHESGDLISFIQKIENLSFAEAIVYIAEKVGIEVVEDTSSRHHDPEAELRKRLRDMLYAYREACRHYLQDSPSVMDYVKSRGLSDESVAQFYVGYNPVDFNVLEFFKEKGYSVEECVKSGLLYKTDQGSLIPRFKGRLIFPVVDYQGRTLGFGGRILEKDQHGAKYVNSEESKMFNKRMLLYGLYQAKKGIKDRGYALLVEGYMDVAICAQFGFTNAIASMGTALTSEQAQKIKRFTDVVYLAMDSDDAGQSAMARSYDVLSQQGITPYFVQLDAKDPADMLLEKGADAFQSVLDNALPVVEFQFLMAMRQYDKQKIEQVPKIIQAIVPFLEKERDDIVRRHYVQKFSRELGVDEELVMAKFAKGRYTINNRKFHHVRNKKTKIELAEESLIALAAVDNDLRQVIFEELKPEDFKNDTLRELARLVSNTDLLEQDLLAYVSSEDPRRKLSQLLVSDDVVSKDSRNQQQAREYIDVLQGQKRQIKAEELKKRIKECEIQGDTESISELLVELQKIKLSRGDVHG